MKIGDWEISALVSGTFRLDGGAMFGVVPKTMWARVAPPDELNRIAMAMRVMVVRGREKTIIVDTGAGVGYDPKWVEIYAFESRMPISETVRSLGVAPGEITDVILTHLHFDHGGGVAYPDRNTWRLAFPNAVHHVQRIHWEHALRPNPRDRASFVRERIEIIEQKGVLEFHDGPWTLAPGIDLLVCNGHTPGQHLPKIRGGGETLLYCGDLIPTSAHIPIPYIMSYDLQPVVSMAEKQRVLEEALEDNWLLFFEHDAFVTACRVEKQGGRIVAGEPLDL